MSRQLNAGLPHGALASDDISSDDLWLLIKRDGGGSRIEVVELDQDL